MNAEDLQKTLSNYPETGMHKNPTQSMSAIPSTSDTGFQWSSLASLPHYNFMTAMRGSRSLSLPHARGSCSQAPRLMLDSVFAVNPI
mmetsp:Transcript_747/g.1855  ORF Transcript_747/g.1855 Transcript_747/m.1855 type:complete len:87 (+) Transcript_747:464-724(+)|eukprot:52650-Pelagomonas_calceolata.AAC.1